MLENQAAVREIFEKLSVRKENPSSMYKIDKKFCDKLYRAKRKSDQQLFVIKSVKRADLEQNPTE